MAVVVVRAWASVVVVCEEWKAVARGRRWWRGGRRREGHLEGARVALRREHGHALAQGRRGGGRDEEVSGADELGFTTQHPRRDRVEQAHLRPE